MDTNKMTNVILERKTKAELNGMVAYCYKGISALIQFFKNNKELIKSSIESEELFIEIKDAPICNAIALYACDAWHIAIDPSFKDQVVDELPWIESLISA